MKVLAVIPARYNSSRFPGKPLAKIAGVEMVKRIYDNCLAAKRVADVVVATDDKRIADFVSSFGGTARMTSLQHESGTDRVAEVAAGVEHEVVLNMQGDEPLVTGGMLDEILAAFEATDAEMGTAAIAMEEGEDVADSNLVKVALGLKGEALYFSRSIIPFRRADGEQMPFHRHLGIYVYRRDFLLEFSRLPIGRLEKAEKLEQLRALENGMRISVAVVEGRTQSVDVEADISRVEAILNNQGSC